MTEQEMCEKVINGLECCAAMSGDKCRECPYSKECLDADLPYGMPHLAANALALLKAQEHEALDMPKPDSEIGCWYDITHSYTLEQVVSVLKSRELCEDAVSRKYLLDQSYSIKFQTIDESDEEAYREKVVCVEDIEDAPSVQPVPMARVMTLEELIGIYNLRENHSWVYNTPPYLYMDYGKDAGHWIAWSNIVSCLERCYPKYIPEDYGKTWRCWTSRPTDEQREAVKWE